ncbi:YheE family protein [Bacillus sp. T33-2]|uniref:YheE family protein n=1 Tax=Bacillus sp. T33-2 TaxID=2054168 RepID=UPI000C77962E|nr:YheE family protein [Bacillus sp. T33-2]PLR89935.1 hypothetical protein CVD19_22955 [Bacillus sp. T33-2]
MITHFQYKPLFENTKIPGWRISFYYKKQHFSGVYHQNGKIEWTGTVPATDIIHGLEAQIHELMLFHVYDK